MPSGPFLPAALVAVGKHRLRVSLPLRSLVVGVLELRASRTRPPYPEIELYSN